MNTLTISGSPHVHGDDSVKKIMYGVVYALIPAILVSVYFFGLGAVRVLLVSSIACMFFEWIIQKYIIKGPPTINDGSALVAGVLLAFNVPANMPSWILIIGAFVTIAIAKMSFGGLGKNPFNPALVGRIFLLISFPVQMTSWPKPSALFAGDALTDTVTGPTPLGLLKEELGKGRTVPEIMQEMPGYVNELLGNQGGCIGEVSAAALILGALYMLIRRIITWHTPVAYLGTVFVFTGILYFMDPLQYVNPLFHLVTGGLMLGVFFMATDMVTTPVSRRGMWIFGAGAGILTVIIRIWGGYPEGVAFAILIMNAFTPLINRGFKPKRFGEKVADA
ncbi:MAG: RnfABCDGE type electron transport complex subunit D [Bacteroidales bacterium]